MRIMNDWIIFLVISVMIASPIRLLSQDSDSIYTKYLISFSYTFDLINGQLEGTGGEILEAAITDTDMLLLGNNTRDKMESDLSLTLAHKDLYVQSMTLLDSSVRLSRHRFVKIKRAISDIIKNATYGRNEFRKK